MKIHEQEWKAQGNGVIAVSDAVVIKVEVAPWRLPRVPGTDDWEMAAKVSQQVTNAVEAAPKMARALLMQATTNAHGASCWCATPRTGHDSHEMRCIEARDALRSAGVL